MLNHQAKRLTQKALFADGLTIVASFLLANYYAETNGKADAVGYSHWILLAIIPVWYGVFSWLGVYKSVRTRRLHENMTMVLKGSAVGGIIVATVILLVEPIGYRGFFLYFLSLSTLLFMLQKTTFLMVVKFLKRNGLRKRHIVIVGTGEEAARFIRCMNEHLEWGLKIIGLIRSDGGRNPAALCGYKVVGDLHDLVEICRKSAVDEVVFCEPSGGGEVSKHLEALEEMGIKVRMVLDPGNILCSRKEFSLFHGEFPILTISNSPINESHIVFKRFLDIVGSLVGLSILAILFPFIAVAIRLESKGPVLFGQDRVGENGRIFQCWKFRSMYLDAEDRKAEILHMNEMNGGMFKVRNDPRVTRVGRFLRKGSLDEWPQFWNVLTGEMSLVGPRPLPIGDVEMVENRHRRRLSVKPGITGLWQVSGRSEIVDFNQVVQLDLEYINNWNFWLDFRILLKTCFVVFTGHGSY